MSLPLGSSVKVLLLFETDGDEDICSQKPSSKKSPLPSAFDNCIVPEQFVLLVLTVIEDVSIDSENRIRMFVFWFASRSPHPFPFTQELPSIT